MSPSRLSSAGAWTLAALAAAALAACNPQPADPAPPVGYETAELEARSPDLMGGPDDYGPEAYGPDAREPDGDGSLTEVPPEGEPATLESAPDPWREPPVVVDPAAPPPLDDGAVAPMADAPMTESAGSAEGDWDGPDVIGQPALPRDYSAAAPPPPPWPESPAPPAYVLPPAPTTVAPAAGSSGVAAASGMSPIPDPPERAPTGAASGLLGGPAPAGSAPATRRAEPRPAARDSAPAPRPARPRAAASPGGAVTPVQTLTAKLEAEVKTASLKGATALKPGQTGDVSLSLPASLATSLADPAVGGPRAAEPTVSATLSGEGYVIDPAGRRTVPATAGRPTAFAWKVTPDSDGGRAPLMAAIEAEVGPAGDRDRLVLGAVSDRQPVAVERPPSGSVWWTVGLILAAGAVAVALLRRGSSRPPRRPSRPLDIGPGHPSLTRNPT